MKETPFFQSAGFTLCTQGSVERLVGGHLCTHGAGTLMLISPAVPVVELTRSEDYAEVTVSETIEHLSALVMPHIAQLIEAGYMAHPYISLNKDQQRKFIECAKDIQEKEQQYFDVPVNQTELTGKILMLKREELLLEMLLLMLGQTPIAPTKPTRQELIASEFLFSLGQQYLIHRNVAYYAEKAGLTPRHFSLLVREQTGRTPMEWITLVTISHAKRLLLQPDTQVKAVSDSLGFPEQFTFRKYFKKHTGLSPTEFRKG